MRVLVTGSRELTSVTPVYHALRLASEQAGGLEHLIVRHGHCPKGADAYAHKWCSALPEVTEERRPADWDRYGKAAGFIRNKAMVDEGGIDLVLAFPRGRARGTVDCIDHARAAGLDIIYG